LNLKQPIQNFKIISITKINELPAVKSLVILYRYTDWPGSILMAKADCFLFQQVKGKVK
jgi:hypothetical protein